MLSLFNVPIIFMGNINYVVKILLEEGFREALAKK